MPNAAASQLSARYGAKGPSFAVSSACASGAQAIGLGAMLIRGGIVDRAIVGGAEACMTSSGMRSWEALRVLTPDACRPFSKDRSGMVLGEGAAVACLELGEKENALAYIEGIGYATDDIEHNISISDEANCFQKSMKMALENTPIQEVDMVVMHAPGTIKGDNSEFKAIQNVFEEKLPALTTNKWKIGHTFGASGMLSIELALLMLKNNQGIDTPFYKNKSLKNINKVLVNAVGFGGNAVSILLTKNN